MYTQYRKLCPKRSTRQAPCSGVGPDTVREAISRLALACARLAILDEFFMTDIGRFIERFTSGTDHGPSSLLDSERNSRLDIGAR